MLGGFASYKVRCKVMFLAENQEISWQTKASAVDDDDYEMYFSVKKHYI
jgi:hypothetical protein